MAYLIIVTLLNKAWLAIVQRNVDSGGSPLDTLLGISNKTFENIL